MQPTQLTADSFASYPPEAQRLAQANLRLLHDLPLAFVAIQLHELIAYDWKFPAERRELNQQLAFLNGLTGGERLEVMRGFSSLQLSPQLERTDWINDPAGFVEQLTAMLWSTHQMDRFRSVASAYADAVAKGMPAQRVPASRLGIVVIGAGVPQSSSPLFRKLRPYGLHFTHVLPDNGFEALLAESSKRAAVAEANADGKFAHWYIDGQGPSAYDGALTYISYAQLEAPRQALLKHIQEAISSGHIGPEELRSLLARMKPAEIGLQGSGDRELLNRFQVSLLTEGSGTQIFATTFVQWAARECLRRAQPETLLVRFTPRQQAQTMNAMLTGAPVSGLDPQGSLVDADMAAFYTWINMRRLSGSDHLRFLVWYEGHNQALAIGPGLPANTSSDTARNMQQILTLLS